MALNLQADPIVRCNKCKRNTRELLDGLCSACAPPLSMQASARQRTANAANAQLSTGPLTTDKTRFNARTHGLTSREVVIPGKEDPQEFASLLIDLQDSYHPTNAIQALLVARVAVCFWRLRRVMRVDTESLTRGEDIWDAPNIETISRYETTLERSLYRAMAELRVLQGE